MHNDASSANDMLTGIMHPRGVAIDPQPMVISHLGDRHPGTVSPNNSTYEV